MQTVLLGIFCWISISLGSAALWTWCCLNADRRYSHNFRSVQLRRPWTRSRASTSKPHRNAKLRGCLWPNRKLPAPPSRLNWTLPEAISTP
jgi:hypothetical protein